MNPASPRVVRRSESVLDRGRRAVTIRASHADLETTFASAPHGEALLDRQLRYVRVNGFFADLGGRPAADHLGKTPRELASELGALLEPVLRNVVKTGQPTLGWEQRLSTRERGVLDVLANFDYPVRARSGRVVGVGATVFDATGRTRPVTQAGTHGEGSEHSFFTTFTRVRSTMATSPSRTVGIPRMSIRTDTPCRSHGGPSLQGPILAEIAARSSGVSAQRSSSAPLMMRTTGP